MKNFLRLSAVVWLLASVAVRATELTDLGQGLSYLRIHSLADAGSALEKAVPGTRALVLDLRHATATDDSIAALKTALAARPAESELFVLVSPATPAAFAPALGSALTLGAPGSAPEPKVVVQTDAATDRRAYDALDAATPVADLISGKIEKERYDEATLVEEFKNGNLNAEPPALSRVDGPPGPDSTAPKPNSPTAKEPPLVDRVLQRAVHLHRAMVALRRSAG
jgi:hypothetical protein